MNGLLLHALKVDYIRSSRDIPVKRAQEAELSLLAGNVNDAEGILLQAGQSPGITIFFDWTDKIET